MIPPKDSFEENIFVLGNQIFDSIQKNTTSPLSPDFYTDKLMDWSMKDEAFRVNLLRFVDVMPSLNRASDVIEHTHEYFHPVKDKIPSIGRWALYMNPKSFLGNGVSFLIKKQIELMAKRFIVSQTPEEGVKILKKIRNKGMAFTIPLLGEAVVSEKESQDYLNRYLSLIETLDIAVRKWDECKPIIEGHPGEKYIANISVKLSVLYSQAKPEAPELAVQILSERLLTILEKAHKHNCFVYVDMEEHAFVDITLATVKNVLTKTNSENLGIVLQAYLRRTEHDLLDLIEWIKTIHKRRLNIRLVKGAYWDAETIHAKLEQWPIPVFQEKSMSDFNYEKLTKIALDNHKWIYPAFGSHNIRSLCHAIEYAKYIGLTNKDYELQSLYGMGQPIKDAFLKQNVLIREYAPVGEFITGIAYLVRRILENTSNKGFIRHSFYEHETPEKLLQKPNPQNKNTGNEHINKDNFMKFTNSPFTDFSIKANQDNLALHINKLKETLLNQPETVHPIIAGNKIQSDTIINSICPENKDFILANIYMASKEQCDSALTQLKQNTEKWRNTPIDERAEILLKTANILEERRFEFSAYVILETGKPWIEADADIAEAIDFLNYYAHHAKELFKVKNLCHLEGEDDFYFYEPRGVCLVIAPWNFPCAIPCGMFSAALVTGNCPILKPAEQSSLVAYKLYECFLEAGMPSDVAAFIPGYGEDIGAYMVNDKRIDTIVFTGSKDVGLNIVQEASNTVSGQKHVKRVISEMGGKNAIIIDSDADLDIAVKGVIQSAFSYAGQKCSACSRVIVLESAYDLFLSRIKDAVESVIVGNSTEPQTLTGPVVDHDAYNRLNRIIHESAERGVIHAQAKLPDYKDKGYFITPTIIKEVDSNDPLCVNEHFGPFLAVLKANDFQEAVEIAMSTPYALTGAVFTRNPKNLEYAVQNFRVGNLYLNRGCTGAMVGRQPFGGAHMSGTGSKAGGPDYLHQFVIPRTICENTMRQGFAPIKKN